MEFQIVIPMYNASAWIEENLRMIQNQTFREFKCIVIDDRSTDDSVERVQRLITNDCRFTLLINNTKRFSMGNVCKAINFINPAAEDIIVLVDADDRLSHNDVLRHLYDVYFCTQCWMTYGSYSGRVCGEPDKICKPYPSFVVKNRLFRNVRWRASHLKTFKYHLWRHIRPEAFTIVQDEIQRELIRTLVYGKIRAWLNWRKIRAEELVDVSGRYVRRCVDKAITYPLLELAGPKSFFIKEVLYVYNCYKKDLQFGNGNVEAKWSQRLVRSILKNKMPHPCLAN